MNRSSFGRVSRSVFVGGAAAASIAGVAAIVPKTARADTSATGPQIVFSPLERQTSVVTPSARCFMRNHAGIPKIDPARHRLVIHGLVRTPLAFSVAALMKYPAVTHTHFIECAGNSGGEWQGPSAASVQFSHGLVSCCEWTGVPLRDVLAEAQLLPEAKWLLAEGADAASYDRSIPLEKALDDALLVYGQNGASLRPEQGFPLRLLLPGYEGSTNIKWLRRLKAGAAPWYTREETAEYTELLPSGRARAFNFVQDAKSVIVSPSAGYVLGGHGTHELRGFAWSGRGRITRVEVSTGSSAVWKDAILHEPILSKCFTAFSAHFVWNGDPAMLQSRATDETGYVQPTHARLVAARGYFSTYHNNAIQIWHVAPSGTVTNRA